MPDDGAVESAAPEEYRKMQRNYSAKHVNKTHRQAAEVDLPTSSNMLIRVSGCTPLVRILQKVAELARLNILFER